MSAENRSGSFAVNGHPDENQLLLALERELSPEEAGDVERHLGNCWSCRARSEEMQRGILAFVEYREKRFLPLLESPPDEFRQFGGRLRAVVEERRSASLLIRLWRKFQALFTWRGQVRWVSAVATAMVAVILWVEVIHPPIVSANELLTRAVAAQNPLASGHVGDSSRVAHQTLQVRSGSRSVLRKFEWAIGSPVPKARWETQQNPLDWDAPLTAADFGEWRNTLREKKDTVRRSGTLLTLDTSTSENPIREAWIVVRSSDFHPVEQHLRFFNNVQLDLIETAFQVTDQAPPKTEAAPVLTEKPQSTTAKPVQTKPTPPEPDLEETELQLRYLLFTHQWDLGEDLVISRLSGRVKLSGTVSSSDRERAVRAALGTLTNVQLSVVAPERAIGVLPASPHSSAGKTRQPTASPLLNDTLDKNFTSREERMAFVERSLDASDQALSHAWALKRLAERYTASDERLLKPDSRVRLHEMLRAHLQQIRRANANLTPLLDLLGSAADAGPGVAPSTWQACILSLFTQVQQQDRLIAKLLVGTVAEEQDLLSESARFRSTHMRIADLLTSAGNRLGESR